MPLTSLIEYVQALDTSATDGSGKTGLGFGDITAKYLTQGGVLTSLTTETITTLGTYQAPTSNAHIRIKELANTDPTKGIYEVHFHDDQIASAGKRLRAFFSATGARFIPLGLDLLLNDVKSLNESTQSLTDLRDFADTGYDPATHKVQGVVLVDTATNTGTLNGSAIVQANVASFEDGAITDAAFTTGAISADAIAADAINEIQSGLATAADLTLVKAKTDQLTFTVANAVDINVVAWLGYVATVDGNNYPFIGSVNTKTGYALTGAYDPAKTAAQATEQAAIKTKTDQLTFTVANKVDSTATATLDQDAIDDIAAAVIAGVDMATPNEIAAALTNIGTVELIGPMLTGAAHKIVRGSAYLSAISTAPYVLVAKATYDLAGATAEFRMKLDRQTAVIITASIVSYDATYWKVYADLTASNTDDMAPGTGHDQFWVTLSGGAVVCLSQNYLEVIAGIGVA